MASLITQLPSLNSLLMLEDQGFMISRDIEGSMPKLPEDITELDDEDLIRLFQHINEYTKFVKVQVVAAQIDESNAKKKLDYLEFQKSAAYNGTKMTVTAIKAAIGVDPEVEERSNIYQTMHDYRKLMEVVLSNLESDMNLVSRELTRRTASSSFRSRGSKFTI
jgi:hypothetical protein